MKEIVHFTKNDSPVCQAMIPVIDKFVKDHPDIHYSKVDVNEDKGLC